MAVLTGLKPTSHQIVSESNITGWSNIPGWYDASTTSEGYVGIVGDTPGAGGMKLLGFDMSAIPDDATIDGIELIVRIHSSRSGYEVGINARLEYSPYVIAKTTTTTSTSYQNKTVGGAADLWGMALTPASLKSPDFLLYLTFRNNDPGTTRLYIADLYLNVYYTPAPPPPAHGTLVVSDEPETVAGIGKTVISGSLPLADDEDVFEAVLDFPDFFVVRMAITDGRDEVSGDSTLEVKGRADITDVGEVVGATGTVTIDSDLSIEDLGDIVEMSTTDIRPGPVAHINAVRSADRKTTTLTWSTAQRASRYQIMRSDDMRGTWEELAETTATTYTDSHYNATANYTYSVYAVSASGHRGQSSPPAYSFGVDFARRVTL